MIGNNQLELNQATMVQAVQVWVDQTFTSPRPKVISVDKCRESYSEGFVVKLGEQEGEKS